MSPRIPRCPRSRYWVGQGHRQRKPGRGDNSHSTRGRAPARYAPARHIVGDRGAVQTRDLLFRNESVTSDFSTEVYSKPGPQGQYWDDLAGQAIALLAAVAAGQPVPVPLLTGLAAAVLDAPTVRAAHAVLAGGPHQRTRAVELAEQLLRSTSSAAGNTKTSSSLS